MSVMVMRKTRQGCPAHGPASYSPYLGLGTDTQWRPSAVKRYREGRDKGCAWLMTKLRSDGSFGDGQPDVREYYKVPCAFLVCGESEAAHRLLHWVRRNGMTPEGDFGPRPEGMSEYWYTYTNSWVVIGAHRLNQFDLSQRGMDFIMRTWDPVSGGFYSSPGPGGSADTLMDLWVVAGAARAALITNRADAARGAGRWMKRMMEQQPNYPTQMYTVANRAKGVITTPAPGEIIRYVLERDATEGDQYFFHPGIAGGFLANLYQSTGESEWLDLARQYMTLAEGATDHLFELLRAGKVGWAASVLYTLTGEEKYKRMAIKVGDNLLDRQASAGYWSNGDPAEASVDATAELTVWLDEIYQAVDRG